MQFKQGRLFKAIYLFLTTASILLAGMPASSSPLRLGASYAPPYYIVDQDKQVTGILVDLMSSVMFNAKLDFTWKPYPTKRIYSNLSKGKIDIYLGPFKPNLPGFEESVLHSTVSPTKIELFSYYLGDNPAITRKEDFIGSSIIIRRGYTYGGLLNFIKDPANHITAYEVESFAQAVKMLKRGRGEYYLDYHKSGLLYFSTHSMAGFNSSTLASVDLYFMVSKQLPNAQTILKKLEDSFLEVQNRTGLGN